MCGCSGGAAAAAYPMTSGDLAPQKVAGAPRFAVVSKSEVDAETGAAKVLDTFVDYREADLFRSSVDGKIRTIKR